MHGCVVVKFVTKAQKSEFARTQRLVLSLSMQDGRRLFLSTGRGQPINPRFCEAAGKRYHIPMTRISFCECRAGSWGKRTGVQYRGLKAPPPPPQYFVDNVGPLLNLLFSPSRSCLLVPTPQLFSQVPLNCLFVAHDVSVRIVRVARDIFGQMCAL